jgi:DNA-binding beta-propeller fold protein YncE
MDAAIGRNRYEVVDGFFKRPKGWTFVEGADVGIDRDDNVYVFCRGNHPVMIFDKEGNFLDAWGEKSELYFTFPHGLSVGPDGCVYTADTRDHTVRKWTKDGKLLMVLGTAFQPAAPLSAKPFNRPSHAAPASNGNVYVSDGHGNAQIHCFSPQGELLFSWGSFGVGPGQFNVVHDVFIDHDGNDTVYAADRANNRIQFFTSSGEYLGQWDNLLMPQSVRRGPDGNFYVAELAHRVTVLDRAGAVLARWGDETDVEEAPAGGAAFAIPTAAAQHPKERVRREPGPGLFCAPHGIAVDSQGSIYVAEAAESWAGLDRGSRSIQKFVRV